MKLKVERILKPVNTPNFMVTELGDAIPIQDFSDEQLQLIGEDWTKRLVELAQKKRKL